MKNYTIQKVVTRNFLLDFWTTIQNFLGMNLTTYERMIKKGTDQIEQEIKDKKIKLLWYRYEITQLTNGAIAIMLYGDKK